MCPGATGDLSECDTQMGRQDGSAWWCGAVLREGGKGGVWVRGRGRGGGGCVVQEVAALAVGSNGSVGAVECDVVPLPLESRQGPKETELAGLFERDP